MPWREQCSMSLREEVIVLIQRNECSVAEAARRYGVARKTLYKWLNRADQDPGAPLRDQSRRPRTSPRQTPAAMVDVILTARAETGWGGRKLHQYLEQQGHDGVPSPATITAVVKRHGGEDPATTLAAAPRQWERFTAPAPNDLWQMDFKSPVVLRSGTVHPLLILDDYSRFVVSVTVESNQRVETIQHTLEQVFRRYGLPARMLADNGPPWGLSHVVAGRPLTRLTAWLVRLGIHLTHGRPYHPQTQGKVERCMRTLGAEALRFAPIHDTASLTTHLLAWRDRYNRHRPHEALGNDVPLQHYQLSPRPFPDPIPPLLYEPDDLVARVSAQGFIRIARKRFFISQAIGGEPVAMRPTDTDGVFTVWYGGHLLKHIDYAHPNDVRQV